jgi:hypothetical protein
MSVPDNALAPVRQLEIPMPAHEGGKLRLDHLLDQTFRPRAKNFSQRIVNFVWLTQKDDSIFIHGVTLLREVRALDTNPVTPLPITPSSPSFRHSSHSA